MTTSGEKIELTQQERDFIKRRPGKTAPLAVVRFRGPRGRKYRPIRTKPMLNADLVREAAAEIRSRPYANGAFATGADIVTVNFLGYVEARESA